MNIYGLPITSTLMFLNNYKGVSLVTAIIEILVYVALVGSYCAGLSLMFRKAGEHPAKSIIPIYNVYTLYELVWTKKKFMTWFVPSLVLIVLSLITKALNIGAVSAIMLMLACLLIVFFHILVSDKIAHAYGESTGVTIGLMLLTPVYYLLVGCDGSQYMGNDNETENHENAQNAPRSMKKSQQNARKAKKVKNKENKADKKNMKTKKKDKAEKKASRTEKLSKEEKKAMKAERKAEKAELKEEKVANKKSKKESEKRAAMKKRDKAEKETRESRKTRTTKKSKKELKAEKKRYDRDAHGDGTSDADFFVKKEYDAYGHVKTPSYELSEDEKRILANLKLEKSKGNFKRELTVEERLALEKLRQVRSIGM